MAAKLPLKVPQVFPAHALSKENKDPDNDDET